MANILGRMTLDTLEILEVDANPMLSAGTPSSVGSYALYNGSIWLKSSASDTGRSNCITSTSSTDDVFSFPNTDGVSGQYLETNGNMTGMTWNSNTYNYGSSAFTLTDEFMTQTVVGTLIWVAVSVGLGAAVSQNTTDMTSANKAIGCIQLTTGTILSGRSAVTTGNNILLGFCTILNDWRSKLAVLSNAGDEYTYRFGLFDNPNAGDAADGVYFEYDRTQSVNWRICTAQASTRTKVNTTVAVNTNYNYFKLIVTNGTNVDYYINNTLVGSITTNIPITNGQFTGFTAKIEKSAGLSSVQANIDYFNAEISNISR